MDMIGSLQSQGAKWVINTGRDMSSLMETLGRAGIDIEPDYLVLVEREMHQHHESQYSPLDDWNSACVRSHAELFAAVTPQVPRLVEWINARFHARIYEDPYSPFCLIAGNNCDADQIHKYLEEFCAEFPNLTVVRNDVYARFSHQAYNKGTALSELTRRLGLTPASVFAAGDHWNDLPMLTKQHAHWLAAPSNSVPQIKEQVKAQGGFVSELPQGRGVLDAIKYYLAGCEA